MADEKLLYVRTNYKPSSSPKITPPNNSSPQAGRRVPADQNLSSPSLPAHILNKNRNDVTVFEKPTTGPLLYVRKPVTKEQSIPKNQVWGSQDDEEAVRRDTERRRNLAKQWTDAEKVHQESSIIQKERERREFETQERIRKGNITGYTQSNDTPEFKKMEEQRRLEEQFKHEERRRAEINKRGGGGDHHSSNEQHQFEEELKQREERRLREQEQYEEELRLAEERRQRELDEQYSSPPFNPNEQYSSPPFNPEADEVETRLMLIEQIENLSLELNDKQDFYETLLKQTIEEKKSKLSQNNELDELEANKKELLSKIESKSKQQKQLENTLMDLKSLLEKKQVGVNNFQKRIKRSEAEMKEFKKEFENLSKTIETKKAALAKAEDDHVTAFEALEQTQVPDDEPAAAAPEPSLLNSADEEEMLMRKMLEEEERERQLEEERLREEEERLFKEEEERMIREEEEKLQREEEERQRLEAENKAKEEGGSDYRNLLKKKRNAQTSTPEKDDKKEGGVQQVDFRHLLKKKT